MYVRVFNGDTESEDGYTYQDFYVQDQRVLYKQLTYLVPPLLFYDDLIFK